MATSPLVIASCGAKKAPGAGGAPPHETPLIWQKWERAPGALCKFWFFYRFLGAAPPRGPGAFLAPLEAITSGDVALWG